MTTLKPRNFIKSVLIDELGGMVDGHPYISFIMMGIGIEFLGKCIKSELSDWNSGGSGEVFKNAVRTIPSLQRYQQYLTTHDLYGSFRCGLAHAVSPKYKITLSSKQERAHLVDSGGRLNLKVEDLYTDFRLACEHVIGMSFPRGDKMEKDFLEVPGTGFDSGTNIPTGITSSVSPSSGSTAFDRGASSTPEHLSF
jgi:hypothetical protein